MRNCRVRTFLSAVREASARTSAEHFVATCQRYVLKETVPVCAGRRGKPRDPRAPVARRLVKWKGRAPSRRPLGVGCTDAAASVGTLRLVRSSPQPRKDVSHATHYKRACATHSLDARAPCTYNLHRAQRAGSHVLSDVDVDADGLTRRP